MYRSTLVNGFSIFEDLLTQQYTTYDSECPPHTHPKNLQKLNRTKKFLMLYNSRWVIKFLLQKDSLFKKNNE